MTPLAAPSVDLRHLVGGGQRILGLELGQRLTGVSQGSTFDLLDRARRSSHRIVP